MGGSIEEASKANDALGKIFPLMIAVTLIVVMLQVRSFSMMTMVLFTAPLGLIGVVPTLLVFNQPFGFNAILGLIGLAGILMRNTLILTDQIKENQIAGLDDYHAVIEATVQRTRPVILTALAAVLAFIPLTHSVFWGSMAYMLIGGTAVGRCSSCFSCRRFMPPGSGSSRHRQPPTRSTPDRMPQLHHSPLRKRRSERWASLRKFRL